MSQVKFTAIILAPPDAPKAAFIEFPFSTNELYGTKGRVQVKGTYDGYPFEGTLAPMGGCHIIGINKEIRKAINKKAGDTVFVTMEKDDSVRTVTIPPDFQAALDANPKAKEAFAKYNYSHRKEVVAWINDCKKQETRERRIEKAIEKLGTPSLPKRGGRG